MLCLIMDAFFFVIQFYLCLLVFMQYIGVYKCKLAIPTFIIYTFDTKIAYFNGYILPQSETFVLNVLK